MTYIPRHTRLPIPVISLVREYRTTGATSYSLAAKYGLGQRHISRILHDNLDEFTRAQLGGQKKSAAAKRKWEERKAVLCKQPPPPQPQSPHQRARPAPAATCPLPCPPSTKTLPNRTGATSSASGAGACFKTLWVVEVVLNARP